MIQLFASDANAFELRASLKLALLLYLSLYLSFFLLLLFVVSFHFFPNFSIFFLFSPKIIRVTSKCIEYISSSKISLFPSLPSPSFSLLSISSFYLSLSPLCLFSLLLLSILNKLYQILASTLNSFLLQGSLAFQFIAGHRKIRKILLSVSLSPPSSLSFSITPRIFWHLKCR